MKRIKLSQTNKYLKQNVKNIINQYKLANPGNNASNTQIKNNFHFTVKAYMSEGLGEQQAIEKTLRSREFLSERMFYQNAVLDHLLNDNIDPNNVVGKRKNGTLFKVNPETNKLAGGRSKEELRNSINYKGTIIMRGQTWSKYSFIGKDGCTYYYYETGSPKEDTWQNMISAYDFN